MDLKITVTNFLTVFVFVKNRAKRFNGHIGKRNSRRVQ